MTGSYVGVWTLRSFTIEPGDGSPQRPWGSNLSGLLIYTTEGHVSVSINKDVVRKPGNPEEKDILDSVLFYAGTYKVDGIRIVHQVTQATNPQRIGREMIRFAQLDGTTLTLTTPDESFGKAVLVWRKIE